MPRPTAYQKRQAKARQRRRLNAQERLERDRRQAQQAAQVLEQALHDLGLQMIWWSRSKDVCGANSNCWARSWG